jgi:REP element-mobilizing transposase RayT
MNQKIFYTRNLPHWQPPEETFFVTYRLAGSLPVAVISQLKEKYIFEKSHPDNQLPERKEALRQEYLEAFENELEKNMNEPHWLRNDAVAEIVMESLLFNNNKHYTLWCGCIMSNHVHILLSTLKDSPLLNVLLQNHKKFTAVRCNKILVRSGQFWAEESFDTIIRDNKHFFQVAHYIINNPVKAGIVEKWSDWKWTYIHPEMKEDFLLSPKKSNLNF